MKICIVPTMFPKYKGDYYGSFVFDDAKELAKKGFEVHVVTQHNKGIPYEENMGGVHIHRFKWLEPGEFKALLHFKGFIDNLRLTTYLISLFFYLIWIVRKYNIDIIHAHSVIPTGFIGVIVSKIVRKPVFITVHGMDITNFENRPFYKRLITFSLINSIKTIAVSEYIAKKMISLGSNQENLIILRNAIDTNRFKPLRNSNLRKYYNINDKDVLILFVGYLDIFKGILELLEAFFELNEYNKNLKLMMVGNGPKENILKMKVLDQDLENSVIFTGKIPPVDIHNYYQSADIFVLPSYTDSGGPPLVIMEAMACGLPIIGTNIGGIPEGIEDGMNGFIIPPGNVDEMIKKLNILLKDESLRKKFGNSSLKKIYENSMIQEKKIDELINLYQEQIKNH
ncbi:glycosyltransferase [Methanobacterium spitsbergense]|uniref:Glycosyltransferase n=1 Tax=Methanobacterium spitsbergense TaxID=2874285 RepID=A0A8T5V3C6_9EURY|nr:glycosyltransferase [Methanobacterium spitsbergense]MBZ2166165.1 glycosyltransferase [Methanobacterium spitsbergense]